MTLETRQAFQKATCGNLPWNISDQNPKPRDGGPCCQGRHNLPRNIHINMNLYKHNIYIYVCDSLIFFQQPAITVIPWSITPGSPEAWAGPLPWQWLQLEHPRGYIGDFTGARSCRTSSPLDRLHLQEIGSSAWKMLGAKYFCPEIPTPPPAI